MPYNILGMKLDATSYQDATTMVISWAKAGESRSVFAANTHLVMEAYDSPKFRQVVNSSDLVTSDGMPLVWWLRARGVKDQKRVYGPELMLHICKAAAREKIPVGLFGSTQAVISRLAERLSSQFPDLQIGFIQSPPFRPLNEEEDNLLMKLINESGIKVLFVGLGCPKQEVWIAEHIKKVNSVMLAVGAAFQFHAGVVRQAPNWMQRSGLEWLFRLVQEPGRLWKRYMVVIPRFSFLLLMETLGVIHVQ